MHLTLEHPSASEFKALYDETGWADYPVEAFAAALEGTWVLCTARSAVGELVGMGRLISDGVMHAFVTEMLVAEKARGRGLGALILARLVAEAERRGVRDVQLFAARDRQGFYERNGFVPRAVDAPGMDLVRR